MILNHLKILISKLAQINVMKLECKIYGLVKVQVHVFGKMRTKSGSVTWKLKKVLLLRGNS